MAIPRALTSQTLSTPTSTSSSHSLLGSLQQQQEKVLVQIREQQSRSQKEGGDLRWEGEHGGNLPESRFMFQTLQDLAVPPVYLCTQHVCWGHALPGSLPGQLSGAWT